MCAIDALGTGAMFGTDVVIESRCRACGGPIQIATRDRGIALDHVEPRSTLVWSGNRYEGACAATSLCTVIAFFCRSEEHTSELQSLMRISYAVFCLKKKNKTTQINSIILSSHQH